MDARYTGKFAQTAAQQRAETAAYYAAKQQAEKRQQLAKAYLHQHGFSSPSPREPREQNYRCERCGI